MKKILSIVAALIMISVGFISCKDANEVEINKLIGKWSWTSVQVFEKTQSEEHNYTYDYSNEGVYYEFLSDGKFVMTQIGQGDIDSGSWALANNTLTLKRRDSKEDEVWTVSELTSTSMKLESNFSVEEGMKVKYIYTFTKVRSHSIPYNYI